MFSACYLCFFFNLRKFSEILPFYKTKITFFKYLYSIYYSSQICGWFACDYFEYVYGTQIFCYWIFCFVSSPCFSFQSVLNGMHVIFIPYALMKVNPASWLIMITKFKGRTYFDLFYLTNCDDFLKNNTGIYLCINFS